MDCFELLVFQTALGWTGLLVDSNKIARLRFGFSTQIGLLRSFDEHFDVVDPTPEQKQWIKLLKDYAKGKPVSLESLPLDFSSYSPFQSKVLKQCRKIPFGTTVSYGQLATQSDSPRAARAVGSAMRKNRYPLVIPCHRVVSSKGLGGYSASSGLSVKRKLLALEGVQF